MVGATGEQLRVANWVNQEWLNLQAIHEDWDWLRNSFAFPTVAGQATYTAAQIGITDFGFWARDTFRNYANPVVSISIASPCVVTLPSNNLSVGDSVNFLTTGALPTGISVLTTYYVTALIDADNFTFSTVLAGSPVSTGGAQSGVQTISASNTKTFVGMSSEIFMQYDEYENWRNSYDFGALRQIKTRPLNITITPSKALGLGPFPDVGYTVIGDYYSVPSQLVLDIDIPSLPAKFHLAIVAMAMQSYGNYEAAPDVLAEAQRLLKVWMPRIHNDQMPEIGASGALC